MAALKQLFSLVKTPIFAPLFTVAVAQLVRASDCGSEGRGFETHQPPGETERG